MNNLLIFKRQLRVFAYAQLFWLGLIVLDTAFDLTGMLTGILYWLSLIILYLNVWYLNLPLVNRIANIGWRFASIFILTTFVTTLFMGTGLFIGIHFKRLITG